MKNTNTHNQHGPAPTQLRKHYYMDSFAVIAPQRSKRPNNTSAQEIVSEKDQASHPIEDEESIFEIKDKSGNWQVKVVKNAFPAFTDDNPETKGEHEVILETPKPDTPFAELSVEEITVVLRTYQERIRQLGQRYEFISVFKNHGKRAGASLNHTHSQIIATDIVPPEVRRERAAVTQYQEKHGTSPLCDVIRWELTQGERVVAHTRHNSTICPYASRFPLEAWIVPNRQHHSIVDLSDEEITSLADHLKGVTSALTANAIDYNFHLVEGIDGQSNHFYVKVLPRITYQAGFEHDTGIYINPISPEYARKWYQKYIKIPNVV